MQTIYRPGQWYLMVIPGALVALPPDVPGEILAGLWERLPGTKTLATVVDVLTSHAGGSFTALPPFVAAVAEGADLRIALRGRVVARVSSATDAVEFSGAEVTTWSERFVAGATRVEITVEETGSGSVLTVNSGLVLAAAVSADLEPDDAEQLTSALGPTPVVVSASMGVSAAALAGAPAPLLAAFPVPGGSGSASESTEHDASVGLVVEAGSSEPVESAAEPLVAAVDDAAESPEPVASVLASVGSVAESAPSDVPAGAEALIDAVPTEALPVASISEDDGESGDVESVETSADDESVVPVIDGVTLFPTEVTLAPSTDDDFDQLWGETVHSVSAVSDQPGTKASPVDATGDHDGATISAAELRALRQQPPAVADEVATAVIPVAAAQGGRIRMSTGQVIGLDRTVIIGRRPRSTRASGANMPHLVAVESPQQDISRSHLEIRPEGDTVVVIDLHTTNGSTLLRPGADPLRLHPGEQTLVLSGDVVDLGDGVTVAFEDLP
ncbi:FHA domain-containing protein [Microbacterium sp. LWH12-1.2]|uniref:FHA domain-containing protein n=1 Tax=Microbacterium sp. LWH12-1.2 TaxID=3135259 RepID=UPI00341C95F4